MQTERDYPKVTAESRAYPARERLARIRDILSSGESASIKELAALLSVSEMTIRRDLDELERTGFVQRMHGAAMATDRLYFELDFYQRRQARRNQKRAIAEAAARLVQPGHRLFVDAGSTTLEFVLSIKDIPGIVIVTTSLAVAAALQHSDSAETIILGGTLQAGRPDLGGGFTEDMLDMFSVDMSFQGADGIDLDGWVYNENVASARVGRKMRERCKHAHILADSTKIGRTALMKFGNLRDGGSLITDDEIDPLHLQRFADQLGIHVVTAKAP